MNKASNQELQSIPITIEPAKPEDALAILTLKRDAQLATYAESQQGQTPENIIKDFGDIEEAAEGWAAGIASESETSDRRTLVARRDGKIIGYTSPYTDNGKRRIGQLYIAPDAQGQGIGTQLLERAIAKHGRDQDIYLHVGVSNQKAIRFYEDYGFVKTDLEIPEEFDQEKGINLPAEFEMVLKASN